MRYQAVIKVRLDEPDAIKAMQVAERFCQQLCDESCDDVAELVWVVAESDVLTAHTFDACADSDDCACGHVRDEHVDGHRECQINDGDDCPCPCFELMGPIDEL